MIYYLDTNICIYFLTGRSSSVLNSVKSKSPDQIKIPSLVKAELLFGAEKSDRKSENIERINNFLLPYEIIPFDDDCSVTYSKIRSILERKGTIVGPNDLIIASTVMTNDGILITNNDKEYSYIKGLKISNWIKESG